MIWQRDWNSELGMRNAERKKEDRGIGIRNWEFFRFGIWDSSDFGFGIADFGF